jgi:hypothetical protein
VPRARERLTIRFPSASERYDRLAEATFRHDLERLLDRIAGEQDGGTPVLTFVDQDAAPTVSRGDIFAEANTLATTITSLGGGAVGQRVVIIFSTANTTIQDASIGGVIQLAGGANFVGSANDVLELIWDGTNWYEISRSVN